jgi:hypothetical protein
MSTGLKIAAGVVGGVLALVIGVLASSEMKEVVVLTTTDAAGSPQETRLWVVDDAGALWLRGSPGRGWVTRVQANPEVVLKRGDAQTPYTAVPVDTPEQRERIEQRMREKYGTTDLLIMILEGSPQAFPVRLEPRAAR